MTMFRQRDWRLTGRVRFVKNWFGMEGRQTEECDTATGEMRWRKYRPLEDTFALSRKRSVDNLTRVLASKRETA